MPAAVSVGGGNCARRHTAQPVLGLVVWDLVDLAVCFLDGAVEGWAADELVKGRLADDVAGFSSMLDVLRRRPMPAMAISWMHRAFQAHYLPRQEQTRAPWRVTWGSFTSKTAFQGKRKGRLAGCCEGASGVG